MLKCRHIFEYSSDYLEGRLSFWKKLQFKVHLRTCVYCERFCKQFDISINFTGRCGHEAANREEIAAVLQKIKEAERAAKMKPESS